MSYTCVELGSLQFACEFGRVVFSNQISTWTPQLSTFMSASMRWWGTSLVGVGEAHSKT